MLGRGALLPPPDFCKNYYSGPIGNRFVVLLETGSWTYWKPDCGPIGNRIVDLLETSSWTYWKLVCGAFGNRFVDLLETGSWTYQKPVRARHQKV